jgi:hypothetical protein
MVGAHIASNPAQPARSESPAPQRGPFGVAAVELGLHQRRHLDAVDPQALDVAVDLGSGQIGATDPYPTEIIFSEPGAVQIRPDAAPAR